MPKLIAAALCALALASAAAAAQTRDDFTSEERDGR
jgi:opacity protein-like surface antigen